MRVKRVLIYSKTENESEACSYILKDRELEYSAFLYTQRWRMRVKRVLIYSKTENESEARSYILKDRE